MLKQAIDELYIEFPYSYSLKYSAKFKPYRANVRLSSNHLQFHFSDKWKTVSNDIQIGLVQELLLKILRKRLKSTKKNTQSIELYNIFLKKIHVAVPKTETDPVLDESFNRVNEKYFYNVLEKTNLRWGPHSLSKLGSYEYGTDTIMISKALENTEQGLLDYVMYHEMLHKKHKFERRGTKSFHHTSEFREKEKEFENSALMEKKLKHLPLKKARPFSRFIGHFFIL